MNASLLNPLSQDVPDSVSAALDEGDALVARFNRGPGYFAGHYLGVGRMDGTVVIWDVETRSVLRYFDGAHVKPVRALAWSRWNRYLASAGADWNVIVWDLKTGERERTIRFDAPVAGVEFSPADSRFLLVTLESNDALLVDIRRKVHSTLDQDNNVTSTQEVHSHPTRTPLVQTSPQNHDEQEQLHPDADADADAAAPARAAAAAASITAARFTPDGDLIFAGTSKGAILVFDAHSAEFIVEHKVLGTVSGVRELAFDPSGRHVVVNTNDRAVRILSVTRSGRELGVVHKFQDLVNRTPWNGVGFSGDSEYVVGGAAHKAAHNIYVWDRSAGTLVKILEGPKDSLVDVDWHPQRALLASVSHTGAVYIWFTPTEEIWSAYAPGFEELEENVEYEEREDEFDAADQLAEQRHEEQAFVDVLGFGPSRPRARAGAGAGGAGAQTQAQAQAAPAPSATGERVVTTYRQDLDDEEGFVIPPKLEASVVDEV